MLIELSCEGRVAIAVPGVARLTALPNIPIVVHANCVDLKKAAKVPGLVIKYLDEPAPVVAPVKEEPAVEEPAAIEAEAVEVDKLIREADLTNQEPESNTDATVTPRKRGRPRKNSEE